jgi:hypothetical protein
MLLFYFIKHHHHHHGLGRRGMRSMMRKAIKMN